MESIVFEIKFNDGRIFRVFCANSTQIKRVMKSYHGFKSKAKEIKVITNGIHTTKQYEQILKTI